MANSESRRRPIWPYVTGVLIVAVLVFAFFLIRDLVAFGRPAPELPSLADAPDASLHGTVAYFALDVTDPKGQPTGGCVRIVAAAGAPSRDVLCLTGGEFDTGPQLAFLPDGRLEITMFSWPTEQPLVASWQKIVDPLTGETEDVPVSALPGAPAAAGAGENAAGEQVIARSRSNTVELVLVAPDGASRTLWSADVSPDYTIRVDRAPTGQWALADDGRLLLVTLGDPAEIRVLVAQPGFFGSPASTDPRLVTYDVTDRDLLGAAG